MKKATEYEVQFVGMTYKSNRYVSATKLAKWGFTKHMLVVEKKVAQRAGALFPPSDHRRSTLRRAEPPVLAAAD